MKMARAIAFVSILFIAANAFAQWYVSVYQDDLELPFTFGTDSEATDGFDISLDVCSPPPPPFGLYCYFPISDPDFPTINALLGDYRAIADTVKWQLLLFANAESPRTVAFSWDRYAIPSIYGTVLLDTIEDMSTAVNMMELDEYAFTSPMDMDTIFFLFMAWDTVDTVPPFVMNWFPECGAIDIPIALDSISVDIFDYFPGIDAGSIRFRMLGFDVTDFCILTPISIPGATGYHIAYHLYMELGEDMEVNVQIEAEDFLENPILADCSFHTECSEWYRLSGYVYDDDTGNPIEDATITESSYIYYATSDSMGFYLIDEIPAGIYSFTATASGYGTDTATIAIADTDAYHDFDLPASGMVAITGCVTDSITGLAIDGAIVEAISCSISSSDTTDSAGIYNVQAPTFTPIILIASAEEYFSDTVANNLSSDWSYEFALAPIGAIDEKAVSINSIELMCFPNPFNSSCRIAVRQTFVSVSATEQAGILPCEIEIYDLSGKCVGIFDEMLIIWQPDEPVGSGIYLLKATSGENTITKRIVYMK